MPTTTKINVALFIALLMGGAILDTSIAADSVSKVHHHHHHKSTATTTTASGTLRTPQPHVVRVENYRTQQQESSSTGSPLSSLQNDTDDTIATHVHTTSDEPTSNDDPALSFSSQSAGVGDGTNANLVASATTTTPNANTFLPRIKHMIQTIIHDDLNRQIVATTLPLSAIFAIMPLASAVDLFWINRLKDPLAVAGQTAANQVYGSLFWLFSFLPNITATLVSKRFASNDMEGTQDAVCQALLLGILISVVGTTTMFFNPTKVLNSILKAGSPAMDVAKPFLKIRTFSFLPMLISFVGFSTFRGLMDVKVSAKIALLTNFVVMSLDPLLIHVFGVGVRGAAMATLSGDILAALIYIKLLRDRNLIPIRKLTKLPAWSSVAPLIKGGISLQLKSFSWNIIMLSVARVIQSMDDSGVVPAAHALALQTFQLGSILMGALGAASQTLVPTAIAKSTQQQINDDDVTTYDENGAVVTASVPTSTSTTYAQQLVKRLFVLGSSIGFSIGFIQMLLLPTLLKSSPLPEVREAARIPALLACGFQGINGLVSVGEGVLMGSGSFVWLSITSVLGAVGYLGALQIFPKQFGLTGVWMSSALFWLIRLAGIFLHLSWKNNPLRTTTTTTNK